MSLIRNDFVLYSQSTENYIYMYMCTFLCWFRNILAINDIYIYIYIYIYIWAYIYSVMVAIPIVQLSAKLLAPEHNSFVGASVEFS